MTAAEAERAHLRGPAGSADPNHAPTFIGRHDLDDGAQFLG